MVVDSDLQAPGTSAVADLTFSIDLGTLGSHTRLRGELDEATAVLVTCVVDAQITHGRIDACRHAVAAWWGVADMCDHSSHRRSPSWTGGTGSASVAVDRVRGDGDLHRRTGSRTQGRR